MRDYRAGYEQSLGVLKAAKASKPSLFTKYCLCILACISSITLFLRTSVMLGLGEEASEVNALLRDLRAADVDIVTFGQYLRPTRRHTSVKRYVPPSEFADWQRVAEELGFKYVASGPLVRSSYRAGELFLKGMLEQRAQ